ncbi:hypothetical protein GQ600_1306 [Phytophthora cactorum]|nr:hypothetical protein GQ600_1306 [Phytophthora cactorum]
MSEDEATSTRAHLSVDDNRIIVSWMEDKKNFDAIHGSGGKTSVGGMPKRKKKRRELARGMTLPDKLENMCPQFEQMKAMFGERANVTPSATLELGAPSGTSDGGDSDSSETPATIGGGGQR